MREGVVAIAVPPYEIEIKTEKKQEKALLRPVPKQSYITLSYCGEVSRGEMDKRTEKRAGFSVLCIDQVSCVF